MSRKNRRKRRTTYTKNKRLFVYGIFLDEERRRYYGMTNPEYATVPDYCTYGTYIVEAVYAPKRGLALTGLIVDMPAFVMDDKGKTVDNWAELDALEYNYRRKTVTTSDGEEVWMYVEKGEA